MKNILITVSGSTPQIITESLYDFIVQRKMDINELHIITTTYGKDKCDKFLFKGEEHFLKFCRDYNIASYDISVRIHVIQDRTGKKLNDIRSPEDNQITANFIHMIISDLTKDPENVLLASIAGGRKTMSVYMSYAFELLARKQDRLFHVLVAPVELEFSPAFFYPPPGKQESITIKTKTGEEIKIPSEKALITNAEIPFIRLREHLPFLENIHVDFNELVKLTQHKIDEAFAPVLEIKLREQLVIVRWKNDEWKIKFKPIDIIFYQYMLQKKSIENSKENKHSKALQNAYCKLKPGVESPPLYELKDLKDSRTRINKTLKDIIKNQYIVDQIKIYSKQKFRIATYYIKTYSN